MRACLRVSTCLRARLRACVRAFANCAGRGDQPTERAGAGRQAGGRWGRRTQGRCRTKSRSDTTPAHSIITKARDSLSTICPPGLPLRVVSLGRAPGMNDTTRHDEPREFTIDHHPGTDRPCSRARPAPGFTLALSPSPSLAAPAALSRRVGPLLFLCQCVPPLRPCSPTWLRSIHRPSSGHIGGVLPARCAGKCKMDVLRSRIGPGDRKPDSIPLRPARGQRVSYNMTASYKDR